MVRIVLADDHTIIRSGLRLLLEQQPDFKVVAEAEDGRQAVERVAGHHPDVVILDIGMPRLDGYEVADRIRRMDGPPIVLVALTGWGQDEDKRRSRDAGFDHHLTKPPEPDVVQRLIAACVDASASDGPQSR